MTVVTTTAVEVKEPQSLLDSLHAQIQALTDVRTRLQTVRHIPLRLLRLPPPPLLDPIHDTSSLPPSASASFKMQELKDFSELVKSGPVQVALATAKEGIKAKGAVVGRRERGKRKRPPSPVSPKPYISFQTSPSTSLFPPTLHERAHLRAHDLPNYITKFNAANLNTPCRLQIYLRTGDLTGLRNPVVLRFVVRDVAVFYITLACGKPEDDLGNGDALTAENVTSFGPREQKKPHMRSDYSTYHVLSQRINKMIESDPRVPLQTLICLLQSYAGLFIEPCVVCQRVLSAECHIPPVARVWSWTIEPPKDIFPNATPDFKPTTEGRLAVEEKLSEANSSGLGWWEPRHITCLHL